MSAEYEGASMSDAEDADYGNEAEDESEDTTSLSGGDELSEEISEEAGAYLGEEPDEGDEESDFSKQAKDSEDEESEEKQKKGNRADKRIQSLISEKKKLAEEVAAIKQHNAQVQAHLQQQSYIEQQRQQQAGQEREQYIAMQKELEMIKQQRMLQEEENLDPAERLRRQAVREATDMSRREYEEKFNSLQQQMQQREQKLAQIQEEQERNQRIAAYDNETVMAARKMLSDIPQQFAEPLFEDTKTFILNWSAAHGILPKDGAREVDTFIRKYNLAKSKAKASKNGKTLAKGQNVPSASPTSRRTVKGKARMTNKQAQDAGYVDALDAMRHQPR